MVLPLCNVLVRDEQHAFADFDRVKMSHAAWQVFGSGNGVGAVVVRAMTDPADNTRAALLMVASMTAFTLNDACMKALGGSLPLFQALFVRGVAVSIGLWALAWWMGALRLDLPRRDRGLVLLRSASEAGTAWLFITALFNMPIANVTAILQVLPLTVALAAFVFLSEPLGWRRMLAIIVGLVGVIIIVRPGAEGFNVYSLYVLGAVCLITLREIVTRKIGAQVPSLTIALAAAVVVTAFAGSGALFTDWAPMGARDGLLLGGAVAFIMAAYVFSVMVMRTGDITFAAPFRYSALVAALIVGLVFFGEWPDGWTLLGSLIVVATGLFALYRERIVARRLRAQGQAPV